MPNQLNQTLGRLFRPRVIKRIKGGIATILILAVLLGSATLARAASRPMHYDDLNSAAPGSAENYVTAAKWDKNPVTYSIDNCPRTLDCATAKQAVRESIEAWDAVCGLSLNEVSSGGDIAISWQRGSHGDGNPFDGPGGILAHAFFPVSWLGDLAGDLHLDDDETWIVTPATLPWQVDLKTTVIHEVGHSLGMDHSNDPTAIMWEEYTGIRGLTQDDIAGIQALYGPPTPDEGGPAAATPAPVPPAGQPTGVTATATTALRMRYAPDTSAQQIASIPSQTVLPVLGQNAAGNWLYVIFNGTQGWVAGWYCNINGSLANVPIVPDSGLAPANPPGPNPAPTGVTAQASSNIRMRSGPGTEFAQIATVPLNTVLNVLARNSGANWLYVDYNGTKGWVAAWLCTVSGDLNTVPVRDS